MLLETKKSLRENEEKELIALLFFDFKAAFDCLQWK